MDDLDAILVRATEIFLSDPADATDVELGELLPRLADAGYVHLDGESPTGHFWRFTDAGVGRQRVLELL